MKRILCFLICFGMLFSMTGMVATAADATVNYEEQGTKENPYLISEVDDYIHLTDCVKNGETFEGKYFKQTADIDLHVTSGGTTYGLSAQDVFKGVYDGSGYKIMLANSFNNMNKTQLDQGLFGTLKGTLLNLTVCGYVKNNDDGGIFAYEILDDGKILNCSFVGDARPDQSGHTLNGFASTKNYNAEENGPAIENCFFYGQFTTNHYSVPITDTEGAFENAYYYAFYTNTSTNETSVYTRYLGSNKTTDEMLVLDEILNDNLYSLKAEYDEYEYTTWTSGEFTFNKTTYNTAYFNSAKYYTQFTFEGSGTKKAPYLIADFYDYINLSNNLTAGINFEGKYFKQTADISPSANGDYGALEDSEFAGIYDGAGYTITISATDNDKKIKRLNFGVFGDKLSGLIMNLKVEAHLVAVNDTGIFAREITGNGKIVNCSYVGKIRGQDAKKSYYGFASTKNYNAEENGPAIINCYIAGAIMTYTNKTCYPITDTNGGAFNTYYSLSLTKSGYESSTNDIDYKYSGTSVSVEGTATLYETLNSNITDTAVKVGIAASDLMNWKAGQPINHSSNKTGLANVAVCDTYCLVPDSLFEYNSEKNTITITNDVKIDSAIVILATYNNDTTQLETTLEIGISDFTFNGVNSDGVFEYVKSLEGYNLGTTTQKVKAFCWNGYESLLPLFESVSIK